MADKRIKGITIEIDGNTKKLNESLKDVNKQISQSNAELKDLRSALKLDPKNVELLTQKQEVLKNEIKATSDRLNTLKQYQKDMNELGLDKTQPENYRALSAEITRTEASLKDLNSELKESSKYSLDKLNNSLTGIREKSTELVKTLAKVGTAITGALTTLGVASIKSYAEYEQLIGGVETLFKESADEIKKYAQNAYKTAGLSANDYMETITSFSASLIQSLGGDTKKATKYADQAITDMADNANKMGTSIESIQNAYQGFAKQNYTMLDNLKLGYFGTKTEMERLIKDANRVKQANGEMANLSIERFSDMVEAIHIIQNEMGITGTTAKEADNTILGSVNSMKASWKNLLTAISDDNADMSQAVNNFVDSTITAGKNIVPRIKVAIEGIKKLFNSLVREVFPKLKREIPELKPLINVFEWFIDHKNLVMTAVKGIIGVFVATKIIDFATKVKDATKALTDFATGGTLGAVTTTVTAIIGLATLLTEVFHNETEAQREARLEMERNTDVLNDNLSSWENLQEAKQDSLNKSMSEITYYENLYKELQNITDENGNVQKGYEKRAEFITGQLSEALGIEIDYIDGQIKGYDELAGKIDKLIEKRKAEAILNSQVNAYGEASAKKQEAYQNMIYWDEQLTAKEAELRKLREQGLNEHNSVLYQQIQGQLENLKTNKEEAEDLYKKYNFTVAQYENNLYEFQQEHYDKMSTSSWEYVKTLENADNAEAKERQDKISQAKYDYNYYKEMYEQTGNEMYKTQMENAKRMLDEENVFLGEYKTNMEKNKPQIETVAKGLVDSIEGVLSNGTSTLTITGTSMMGGLIKGIESQKTKAVNSAKSIGNTILGAFNKVFQIHSPSKVMKQIGTYVMEGLEIGMDNEESNLLNQVDDIGNSVINTLYNDTQRAMNGLGGLMKTSLNPTINPSVAYDLNYQLMAKAMKEALQEVDVELDDRAVGKFIDKTISEEVFN